MVKKKNLASSVLSVGINDSVGSISVENGTGSYFSGLESGSYLTITPFGELPTPDNSEIVRISSVSGDVLNVQRGMLNTTAKSFSQGAIVTNAIYVEDFNKVIEEFSISRTSSSMRFSGEKDGEEVIGVDIPMASSSSAGLMSGDDKSRLDSHSHGLGDLNGGSSAGVLKTNASGVVSAGKVKSENVDYTNWPTPAWEDITGFLTGWSADPGTTYAKPQITQLLDGQIVMRGLIRHSAGAGAIIFILPTEYRPNKTLLVRAANGGSACTLYLKSNGEVFKEGGVSDYVSLDNTRYYP